MNKKIPTYLIHGSLGSGKTTLIKNLLKSKEFKNSVIIENEFANINIDEESLKKDCNTSILGIAGGCICCSSGRELFDALTNISKTKNIKALLIETTGVANSVKLIQQLLLSNEFDESFYLCRNIFVLDALESSIDDLKENKKIDIQLADIIIVNKIDLITKKQISTIKNLVKSINKKAIVIETSKGNANIEDIYTSKNSQSPDVLVTLLDKIQDILKLDHSTIIDYIVVTPNKKVDLEELQLFIKVLKKNKVNIKRIKGSFESKSGYYQIEATQKSTEFQKLNTIPSIKSIVFIGENVDKRYFKNFINKYE